MKIEKTERDTYRIIFKHGKLEVNLIPVNGLLPTSTPCGPKWNGEMLYIHDNVGIVALELDGCPPVPRICWDNREHHYWKGYSGGFEPRNTVVNDIKVTHSADEQSVNISFYYISNFVKVTESWRFKEPEDGSFISWDTSYEFTNLNRFTLEKYMSLFACYHQAGKNYYSDNNGKLSECADDFRAFPDEERKERELEMTASLRNTVEGWGVINNPTQAMVLYDKPLLISERREWYKNGQHLFFIEPENCVSIVSAMNQARDYMLAPVNRDLEPQQSFSARVRHIIADIKDKEDLEKKWNVFIKDTKKNK